VSWPFQFGTPGSASAALVGLAVFAAIILVGQLVPVVAWRLVLIALAVAAAL
jgi:hypothetical protein